MPTPYGSRGGVAFSADELRVLGGALAIALQSDPAPEEARDYLRLAEAVDETVREGYRLRSFLLADLARYREALPGAAPGYLDQLEAALTMGYLPRPDDLAALRTLCAEAVGDSETARRLALLRRCESLAERAVRARMGIVPGGRTPLHDETAPREPAAPPHEPVAPPSGPSAAEEEPGREPGEPDPEPGAQPEPASRPDPAPPSDPASPEAEPGATPHPPPSRPVPTPAEVFPPRRDPGRPPERETPEAPEAPEPPAPEEPPAQSKPPTRPEPPEPPTTEWSSDCAEEREPVPA